MTNLLSEHDLELLSELERLELPTLSWGITDRSLTEDEVLRVVEESLERVDDYTTNPRDVLGRLVDHALLTPVVGEPGRFRTRFGESVRLFARLRQLFPKHVRDGTWRAAPELVLDYRVLTRTRRIPRRDIPQDEAITAGVAEFRRGDRALARSVLSHLLSRYGGDRPLARFQADALRHILRMADEQRTTATIVTAGTGSGKTLAFYLPAFVDVVQHLDRSAWTKAVAIYPRVELLKDQLAEAVAHQQHLRPFLTENGIRPIRIGAFFRSTPYRAKEDISKRGWKPLGRESHLSPYLLCWSCGAPTTWPADRRLAGEEVLRCRDCGATTKPGDLALTRESMRENPPDILFTTTEMINRHLSSVSYGHVFGVQRPVRSPRLVLLDEAHTYAGTTGAQTALLLRRWQHAVGAPLHVAGLSATLEDAQEFFARLTGVSASSVATIAPQEGDLRDLGAEYLIALRGNPMSGTQLLSTTIQALMLLRRVEDVDPKRPTDGVFPPRVFAFTDNLDVTNRLYDYLLDAEGRSDRNTPQKDSLASLRSPEGPDLEERRRDGQVWDVVRQIGHSLDGSTTSVSRTSSRDVGVSESSDIVVATSSLEVGFDDIRVGGVLQHKAPPGSAAFIQRRGRGGRRPHARPWSVVVLSDFGRDRRAYQGFEALFDPVLRPNVLPVDNRHVIKIQAAYSLLDWLSTRMVDMGEGSLWSDLSAPADTATPWGRATQQRQRRAAQLLRGLLEDPREQRLLANHVRRALAISHEEADLALWENPRALILAVVPTLLRRLEINWRTVNPPPNADRFGSNPLPEYVPSSLFGELNTPEVELTLPRRGQPDETESVPIAQAMRELTPGRVTRRFSHGGERGARHWVPLPSDGSGLVDADSFLAAPSDLGDFVVQIDGNAVTLRCLRPTRARLEIPDKSVKDSQSAVLHWRSVLEVAEVGVQLDIPSGTSWPSLITSIKFHTHSTRSEIEIARLAVGAEAGEPGRVERTRELQFVRRRGEDQQRVAIGYTGRYDAIRLDLRLPDEWLLPDDATRALRRRWFDWSVQSSPVLAGHAGSFSRGWLAILYRAALTATAAAANISAADAREQLRDVVGPALTKAMRVIFEVSGPDPSADPDDTRAEQRLLDLLGMPDVTSELHRLGACLTGADEPSREFTDEICCATVAAAFRDAFDALAPTVDADSLLVDIPSAANDDRTVAVWLTEDAVGGGGVVEQLLAASATDPRRLFALAEAAVQESGYEWIDRQVSAAVRLSTEDPSVSDAFRRYRSSGRIADAREELRHLREVLLQRGVSWSHGVGSTVAARVLRVGSSAATDALIIELHDVWTRLESLVGFETDARVVAFCARNDVDVEQATGLTPPPKAEAWRFSQLYGLLWPRGFDARAATLSAYSPFASVAEPNRLVVAPLLREARRRIVLDSDWRGHLDETLVRDGVAVLVADSEQSDLTKLALLELASTPTDIGYLFVYPRIVGVAAVDGKTEITVELDEAP